MIPKAAVEDYVGRELDSHDWIKAASKKELWAMVDELRPRPNLWPDLGQHQLACFLLGVAYPQFAFWLDMGTGKTLIALELLNYWYARGRIKRAVIFVTSDKAFPTWEKQIKRYNINMPYVMLEGSSETKWRQHAEFGDGLVIVAYPGASAMVTNIVKQKKGKHKGKGKRKFDKKLVERFWARVGAVVIDESTRAANHQSLAFNLIDNAWADYRYALAGRPFGRDPTLLWAQHYLIDRGETLGTTLGMFREAFFTSEVNEFAARHVGKKRAQYIRKFKFDKRKEPKLAKLIQHRAITYSAEECIDVPKFVPILEEVNFPQEAEAYYDKAVEAVIAAKGDHVEVGNVFLRMRQLSSGFLGYTDDESGERAQVEFEENPKFDRLMDLLDEVPYDRKAIVFYQYTYSGRKIAEAAREELGMEPIWLWSGTKNYRADLRRFEENPRCRLAVVNNQVGAMSLDGLQVANYCFFYESPVSPIDREQAERRLRRQGQKRKVFQYDLVVRGSVDYKILDFHKEGEGLMKALLRNPKGVFRG